MLYLVIKLTRGLFEQLMNELQENYLMKTNFLKLLTFKKIFN